MQQLQRPSCCPAECTRSRAAVRRYHSVCNSRCLETCYAFACRAAHGAAGHHSRRDSAVHWLPCSQVLRVQQPSACDAAASAFQDDSLTEQLAAQHMQLHKKPGTAHIGVPRCWLFKSFDAQWLLLSAVHLSCLAHTLHCLCCVAPSASYGLAGQASTAMHWRSWYLRSFRTTSDAGSPLCQTHPGFATVSIRLQPLPSAHLTMISLSALPGRLFCASCVALLCFAACRSGPSGQHLAPLWASCCCFHVGSRPGGSTP